MDGQSCLARGNRLIDIADQGHLGLDADLLLCEDRKARQRAKSAASEVATGRKGAARSGPRGRSKVRRGSGVWAAVGASGLRGFGASGLRGFGASGLRGFGASGLRGLIVQRSLPNHPDRSAVRRPMGPSPRPASSNKATTAATPALSETVPVMVVSPDEWQGIIHADGRHRNATATLSASTPLPACLTRGQGFKAQLPGGPRAGRQWRLDAAPFIEAAMRLSTVSTASTKRASARWA